MKKATMLGVFLWGALEASFIWLVCVFPPIKGSWTPNLLLPLIVSSLGLIFVLVGAIADES